MNDKGILPFVQIDNGDWNDLSSDYVELLPKKISENATTKLNLPHNQVILFVIIKQK